MLDDVNLIPEISNFTSEVSDKLAITIPEVSYWGFASYTMLLPHILKEVKVSVKLPQSSAISGPLWNYLDAACSLITGIQQLTDDTTHRSTSTKVKGAVNIANTIQLTTFTAVNFAMFGGPGFAAAFGIGFILSLEDTLHGIRRYDDFGYWLNDSMKQLQKTQKLMTGLKEDINEMEVALRGLDYNTKKYKLANWALERKNTRLKELQETEQNLQTDLIVRISLRKKNGTDVEILEKFKNDFLNGPQGPFSNILKSICDSNGDIQRILEDYENSNSNSNPIVTLKKRLNLNNFNGYQKKFKQREQAIQAENKANIHHALKDNVIWGMAFLGMLLVCFPAPPVQAAGLIIVGIASCLYLIKNADKLKDSVSWLYSHMTSSKDNDKKEKEDANSDSLFSFCYNSR